MFRLIFLILIGISFAVIQGCKDEKDSAPVKRVEGQIQRCKELLSNGDIDCGHEDFLNFRRGLSECMTNVPSKSAKLELANQYVAMMKDVDLQLHDGNYRNFEMRVLRYEMLTGTIFNALKKAGVDNRTLMDFFLNSMEKYKKACFSLPTTARGENESVRSFSGRKATVGNLLAMYLGRMCTFRQGVMPEHLKLFPSELHEEYKRRSTAILDCPTREDLLKTPLFNGK